MPVQPRRETVDLGAAGAAEELHCLERRVVEASPHVLDTGSLDEFVEFLAAGGRATVEAWRAPDGRLAGYMALSSSGATIELRSVAVDPAFQRRGLGREIVRRAQEAASRQGACRLELVTGPANAPARALYESAGFSVTRVSSNHYGDGADRLVMTWDVS